MFSWLEGERRIVSLDGRKRPCSGTDKVTEAHYCHSLTIPAAIFYSLFFSVLLSLPDPALCRHNNGCLSTLSACSTHSPVVPGLHNRSTFEGYFRCGVALTSLSLDQDRIKRAPHSSSSSSSSSPLILISSSSSSTFSSLRLGLTHGGVSGACMAEPLSDLHQSIITEMGKCLQNVCRPEAQLGRKKNLHVPSFTFERVNMF